MMFFIEEIDFIFFFLFIEDNRAAVVGDIQTIVELAVAVDMALE